MEICDIINETEEGYVSPPTPPPGKSQFLRVTQSLSGLKVLGLTFCFIFCLFALAFNKLALLMICLFPVYSPHPNELEQ
jgi:hypothetical protein